MNVMSPEKMTGLSEVDISHVIIRVFECHFGAFAAMLALFIFLKTNKFFEKRVRHSFYCAILCVCSLVVTDTIVIFYNMANTPSMIQIFSRAMGYILRPLIAIFTLIIVMRGYTFNQSSNIWLKTFHNIGFWLPEIFNIVISLSALYCGLEFSYNSSNQFVRGPMAFTPHIVAIIYEIGIIVGTFKFFKEKNYFEGILLLILLAFSSSAILIDVLVNTRLTVEVSALCVVFYYMYFHAQSQKRDQLTNAYNRRSFFMDAEKYKRDICGLIGIDLNDLKILNDTYGHSAGDKGLITMSNVVNDLLPPRCKLYRTGGDEFVVLCRRVSQDDLKQFVRNVKTQMEKTDYRCALGLAYSDGKQNIDSLYKTADEMMYEDKIKMKAGRNYRENTR